MLNLSLEVMFLLSVFVVLGIMLGVSLVAAYIVGIHRLGDREF